MKNNKLNHVILYYPSMEKGGIEVNIRHLIKYFTNKGVKISLISNKINTKGLRINKKKFELVKTNTKFTYSILPYRFQTSLFSIKKLIETIKNNKKQNTVVFSMQSSMVSILVSKFYKTKIVARNSEDPISSTIYADNYLPSIIVFFLRFIIYNFADGILTNSYGSRKSLKLFLINKNKIKTIYNPYLLNIKKKPNYKKKNIILSAGRLVKQKNFETLIKGFSLFSKDYPNYKLVILGDGPEKEKLKQLIVNLNCDKKIILRGWIKNTNKYFYNSKLFILTSLYEGLGNVFIDAVNHEVPCIYTNCKSGPNEILLGKKGGYQIKLKDYKQLAKTIKKAVVKYKSSVAMIRYSKTKINRFLYDNVCPKYLAYLEKISKL
jgi:glycosyltransferase involved in cell wall biosynthesis